MEQIVFDDATQALIENYETGYVLMIQPEEELADHRFYDFSIGTLNTENAGYDLISAQDLSGPTTPTLLNLGVRAMLVDIETRLPIHYWLLPRSSIYKTGCIMANSVGVIDSSYRGVLKAPVVSVVEGAIGFVKGERYFQIVAPNMGKILVVRRVASLPETARGEGGFGSTGTS
jgi:deoxyuridine 5'-triphosphate nucleotidohydrolase